MKKEYKELNIPLKNILEKMEKLDKFKLKI
jgi:hypothetical protein